MTGIHVIERLDTQIDVAMRHLKGLELRRQPQRRNAGGTAQRHYLVVLLGRKQLVGNRVETLKRFVHRLQVSLARAGQRKPAVMTIKQGRVEVGFQLAHLLADRGLGNIEILGGQGKTQAAAGCFKSSQNI